MFLAVTAISKEYRFALYCITCEDVSCRQHGPPDYNLFSQMKKQLMANGPLFFNMLDVAGVATFIIWISLNPDLSFNDRQGRCRKFLTQLGQELTNDYIQGCLQTKTV